MIDLGALTLAVFNRIAVDPEGEPVRLALGAGAASVLTAEDLRARVVPGVDLPARPLLALRRGAAPVTDRAIVTRPVYTWYALGDEAAGYGAIESLPALVARAYQPYLAVAGTWPADVEVSAGGHERDVTLGGGGGMLLIRIEVAIGAI